MYAVSMKILIADPHPEVQSALHLILNRIPDVTEVIEAGSLVQLLSQCTQSYPDLILLDINLVYPSRSRNHSLVDIISQLRCLCPRGLVVVMSSRFEAEQEAIAAGANGFISKTNPTEEFISSIVGFLKNHS
jgi:DNA-binding NarL/FixJ family response regulator